MIKRAVITLAILLLTACAPAVSQVTKDSVICVKCVPVVVVDSIRDSSRVVDSLLPIITTSKVVARIDTVWKDSLVLVRVDTTWKDSITVRVITTTTYRDSIVVVTIPGSGKHPHEPIGFSRVAEHDFSVPIAKNWAGLAGQAGCWERNGGGNVVNGKYVVTYPTGFVDGKTPATLHVRNKCQTPTGYTQIYTHMIGFIPGDGTPMWNNGEGNKLLFWHLSAGSSPILKCWDYQAGSAGGVRSDCSLNLYANATFAGQRKVYIKSGVPNDIECVMTLNTVGKSDGSVNCWINGQLASWTGLTLRTTSVGVTETWLDWTYGGGGGGVAVGQTSIWTLSAYYVSAR